MPESPLFTKSYDLLRWLIPLAIAFPRSHRFTLAERVQATALDFHETLIAAAKGDDHSARRTLRDADLALERLRFQLRLAHDLGLMSHGQYRDGAERLAEVGRLLGAWIKKDNAARQSGDP